MVTEDEVDLCLRWPDVPYPASATPAPPYPNIPTLILQGGEDLRTPPEWSARIQQRIPGAIRLVIPGVGHSTVSPARARSRRSPISCVTAGRRRPASALATGVPAVEAAPATFESLRGYPGLPTKVGRTVRAVAATIDDLRLVLSPPRSPTRAAGSAEGRGRFARAG